MKPLVLASQSPRRKELMEMAGYQFTCRVAQTDEKFDHEVSYEEALMKIAKEKAYAVKQAHEEVIVSADTLVICDDVIMGKASTASEAKAMLRQLSGKRHVVITGVCILDGDLEECFTSSTYVDFYPVDETFMDAYIASKQANDKAGAYGIQDQGALMIKGIEGDYYTVMGLPIAELSRRLKHYGY